MNWKRGQPIHEIEKNLIVYFLGETLLLKRLLLLEMRTKNASINGLIDMNAQVSWIKCQIPGAQN
jgi:hypothetical protein